MQVKFQFRISIIIQSIRRKGLFGCVFEVFVKITRMSEKLKAFIEQELKHDQELQKKKLQEAEERKQREEIFKHKFDFCKHELILPTISTDIKDLPVSKYTVKDLTANSLNFYSTVRFSINRNQKQKFLEIIGNYDEQKVFVHVTSDNNSQSLNNTKINGDAYSIDKVNKELIENIFFEFVKTVS